MSHEKISKHKNIAIIVAAGRGNRTKGAIPKQYRLANGKPLIRYCLEIFENSPIIDSILVAIHPDDEMLYQQSVDGLTKTLPSIKGGITRQESVRLALSALQDHNPDYVFIHDAARPFLQQGLLHNLYEKVVTDKAVIPAIKVTDTIKTARDNLVMSTPNRDELYKVQTPQAFDYQRIHAYHHRAHEDNKSGLTDDASILETYNQPVTIIAGDEKNKKITTDQDWQLFKTNRPPLPRIGFGFDVHRFEEGNSVILGGISIPYVKKLSGHSDADIVLHALCDAIYGAMAMGDIGFHFPPSEVKWRNANSRIFLDHAVNLLHQNNYMLSNIDITICAEEPRILPERAKIIQNLASLTMLPLSSIGLKATTLEKMGALGRKEGMAAYAVVAITPC